MNARILAAFETVLFNYWLSIGYLENVKPKIDSVTAINLRGFPLV